MGVNKWWHYGHGIASHSVTHRNDIEYWKGMTPEEFKAEAVGQRRITGQFAALDPCEIKGWRSPFLQGTGDTMYGVLKDENFHYDCTWTTNLSKIAQLNRALNAPIRISGFSR